MTAKPAMFNAIYQDFFGLTAAPFGITPDTDFFYANPSHRQALETLAFALQMGEGFVKVTGEVGTGKTLLSRLLFRRLQDEFATAWIPNPRMSDHALWAAVADELEMPVDESTGETDFHKRIGHHLVWLHAQGKPVVLVIDEAQAMGIEALETVRLLTNLETEKRKLLQVVLFGQPELDDQLAQREVRQIRQRITFSYRLQPLDRRAVGEYLEHRLRRAGLNGTNPFSPRAVNRIARASGGVPRLVNIIAHKSLMLAYGQGKHRVGARIASRAAMDTEGAAHGMPRWPLMAVSALFLVGIGALASYGVTHL